MERKTRTKVAAVLVVAPVVALVMTVLCLLGYFACAAFGIPLRLHLPIPIRILGALLLALGLGVFLWLWRYRSPTDIFVSTYISWAKLLRRVPNEEPAERSEPLVVAGPYRWVRHPVYAAVIVLTAGWWLALDYTFLLFVVGLMFVWFDLVVAPFEERELRALFGADYEAYASQTPRLVPSLRRRRGAERPRGGPA